MSTSVEQPKNIEVRRVKVHSPSQLPSDYGTTPGGTMFATTPGGTRIIYDRSFLLGCRNSPLALSPLANMAKIPGVTCPHEKASGSPKSKKPPSNLVADQQLQGKQTTENTEPDKKSTKNTGVAGDDPQFEMDI